MLNCRSLFFGKLNWVHETRGLSSFLWVGFWFPWFESTGSFSTPVLLVFLRLALERRLSISGIEDGYLAVGLALTQIAPPWFLRSFHLAHTLRVSGIFGKRYLRYPYPECSQGTRSVAQLEMCDLVVNL